MKLTKLEKFSYVGSSLFFGLVLIVSGLVASTTDPERVHGIVMICSGLICTSLYGICSLLAKK